MAWVSWTPERVLRKKISLAAVKLSVSLGRGGRWPVLVLSFRPDLMDIPPPWLADGRTVAVFRGDGENGGSIRLEPAKEGQPGVTLRINPIGRRVEGQIRALFLKLPGWPGLANRKLSAIADYDHSDEWIEVDVSEAFGKKPNGPEPAAPPRNDSRPVSGRPLPDAGRNAVQQPIDYEVLLAWAEKNKVDLSVDRTPIDRIRTANAMRKAKGMPPFQVRTSSIP